MTAKKLYRVRLAREVRQEVTLEVMADTPEDAEREALTLPPQLGRPKGWGSGPATEPWVVSIEESA